MAEKNNIYKSMEARFYEDKCRYSLYGELNAHTSGDSEWEIKITAGCKSIWTGSLTELGIIIENLKTAAMTLEEKEDFALSLLEQVKTERRAKIVNAKKVGQIQ